ncbi:MAG: V-type ATP synthase subunit E [Candidatus Aerophobetes bacterium]|nr:V-type ATP synthase subunit E [Candidatus Aerophobetes bacterium]
MGLDDIINKIETKASQEVEKIRQEAIEEREKIIKEAEEEADKVKKDIVGGVKREAEAEKRQRIIRVRMEERKRALKLKWEIMDRLFRRAKEQLDNLPRKEYLNLLRQSLLSHIDSQGEEIVVSLQDKEWIKSHLLKELRENLKGKIKKELRVSTELNGEERGFILKKEGMQVNCTFSSLFVLLREHLEIEVARRLFGPTTVKEGG